MHTSPRVLYVLFILTLCLDEENAMNLDHKHALSPTKEFNVSTLSLVPNRKRRSNDDILNEDDEATKRLVAQELDDFYFLGEVLPEDQLEEKTINVSHGLDSPASTLQMFDPGGSTALKEPEVRLGNTTQLKRLVHQHIRRARDQLIHKFRSHHHHTAFRGGRPSTSLYSEGKPTGFYKRPTPFRNHDWIQSKNDIQKDSFSTSSEPEIQANHNENPFDNVNEQNILNVETNELDKTQLSENTNKEDVNSHQLPNYVMSPDGADESLSRFVKSNEIKQKDIGLPSECGNNLGQVDKKTKEANGDNDNEFLVLNQNYEKSLNPNDDVKLSTLEIDCKTGIPKNSKILVHIPGQIYIKPANGRVAFDQHHSDLNKANKNKSLLDILINDSTGKSCNNPENSENNQPDVKKHCNDQIGGYQLNLKNHRTDQIGGYKLNLKNQRNDQIGGFQLNLKNHRTNQIGGCQTNLNKQKDSQIGGYQIHQINDSGRCTNLVQNINMKDDEVDQLSKHGYLDDFKVDQMLNVLTHDLAAPNINCLEISNKKHNHISESNLSDRRLCSQGNTNVQPTSQSIGLKGSYSQPVQDLNTLSQHQLESVDIDDSYPQPVQDQNSLNQPQLESIDIKGSNPQPVQDQNTLSQHQLESVDIDDSNPQPVQDQNTLNQPQLESIDIKGSYPQPVQDQNTLSQHQLESVDIDDSYPQPVQDQNTLSQPQLESIDIKGSYPQPLQDQNTLCQHQLESVDIDDSYPQPVEDQNTLSQHQFESVDIDDSYPQSVQDQNCLSQSQLESIDVKGSYPQPVQDQKKTIQHSYCGEITGSFIQPRQAQNTPSQQESQFGGLEGSYPQTLEENRNFPIRPKSRFRDFKRSNRDTLRPTLQINVFGQPALQIKDYKINRPETILDHVSSQPKSQFGELENLRPNLDQFREFEVNRPNEDQFREIEKNEPDPESITDNMATRQIAQFTDLEDSEDDPEFIKENMPSRQRSQFTDLEESKPDPEFIKDNILSRRGSQLREFEESKHDLETIKENLPSQQESQFREFEETNSGPETIKDNIPSRQRSQFTEMEESMPNPEFIKDNILSRRGSQLRVFEESKHDLETIKENLPSRQESQFREFEESKSGPETIKDNMPSRQRSQFTDMEESKHDPESIKDNVPSPYESQFRDFKESKHGPATIKVNTPSRQRSQFTDLKESKPEPESIKDNTPSPYESQFRDFEESKHGPATIKDNVPSRQISQFKGLEESKLDPESIQDNMPSPYESQFRDFEESKHGPATIKDNMPSRQKSQFAGLAESKPELESIKDNMPSWQRSQFTDLEESKPEPESIQDNTPSPYESQFRDFEESKHGPESIKDIMPSKSKSQFIDFEGRRSHTKTIKNKYRSRPTSKVPSIHSEEIKPIVDSSKDFVIQLNQFAQQAKVNTEWLHNTTAEKKQEADEPHEKKVGSSYVQWLDALNYDDEYDGYGQPETQPVTPKKRLFRRGLQDEEPGAYEGAAALEGAKVFVGPTGASGAGYSDPQSSRRLDRMIKLYRMRNVDSKQGAYAPKMLVPAVAPRGQRSFHTGKTRYNMRDTYFPVTNSSFATYPENQLVSYNPLIYNMPPEYYRLSKYKSQSPGLQTAHDIPQETSQFSDVNSGPLRYNAIPTDTSQFLRSHDIPSGTSQFSNQDSLNYGAVRSHDIPPGNSQLTNHDRLNYGPVNSHYKPPETSQFSSLNPGPLRYNHMPAGTSQFSDHNSVNYGAVSSHYKPSDISQFSSLNPEPLSYNHRPAGTSHFHNRVNYGAVSSHDIPSDTSPISNSNSGTSIYNDIPAGSSQSPNKDNLSYGGVSSHDKPSETSLFSSLNPEPLSYNHMPAGTSQFSDHNSVNNGAVSSHDIPSDTSPISNSNSGTSINNDIPAGTSQSPNKDNLSYGGASSHDKPSETALFSNQNSEPEVSHETQSKKTQFSNDKSVASDAEESPDKQSTKPQVKNENSPTPGPERCFEVPLHPTRLSHYNSVTNEPLLPYDIPESSQFLDRDSFNAWPATSYSKKYNSPLLNENIQKSDSVIDPAKAADDSPETYGNMDHSYENVLNDAYTDPVIETADGLFMIQPVEEEVDQFQDQRGGEDLLRLKATPQEIKQELDLNLPRADEMMNDQKRDCDCSNEANNTSDPTPIKANHNGSLPYEVFANSDSRMPALGQHKETEEDSVTSTTQKSINETAVLKKMLDELRQIKSEKPINKSKNGIACTLEGTWLTEVAGIKLVIVEREKGEMSVSVMERVPPKKQTLLTKDWTVTARVPFKQDGPFFLTGVSHSQKVVRFIGQCRVCNNKDTVTGLWSFAHSARDCHELDMSMTTTTKRDVFRREKPLTTTTEEPETTTATTKAVGQHSSAESCDRPRARREEDFVDYYYDET